MTKEKAKSQGPNWKIPPQRIPSDDCAVYEGRVIVDGEIKESGTAYHVHKGEWVELFPFRSSNEIMALADAATGTENGATIGQIVRDIGSDGGFDGLFRDK